MSRAFFELLTKFLGDKFLSTLLWSCLVVAAATVTVLAIIAWRRRARGEPTEAVDRVLAVGWGLCQVFGGILLLAFLVAQLSSTRTLFDEQHGRVTAANAQAVQNIWGGPHNQRNLKVRHTVEATEVVEQLKNIDDEKHEEGPAQVVEKRFRRTVRKEVPQSSIVASQHRITVRMNYRQKGSAYYPTFEDDAAFHFVVKNRSSQKTQAEYSFPLPAFQGAVSDLSVKVDGQELGDALSVGREGLAWTRHMAPGETHTVDIAYRSRGMDHWAFRLGGHESLEKFDLVVSIPGRAVENNPIGCMSPTRVVHDRNGTTLEWKLDHAVTNLGMGVILPAAPQPGAHESQILKRAPIALILLVILLVLTRALGGLEVRFLPVMLVAVAGYLFFTGVAYLADLRFPVAASLAVAGGLMTVLCALFYRRHDAGSALWPVQTALFAVMTAGTSALVCERHHVDALLQVLYVALLAYVMGLTLWSLRRRKTLPEEEPAAT
jgi:hypothetical protein